MDETGCQARRERIASGSIGIGLVGMGRHGGRYARHLLEGIPGCHLAAVSRRDAAAGQAFAERHGVAFNADWRDLVTRPEVDAVVVVTPPGLNREVCLEAARAGKPLLVEKPLALTVAEGHEMVGAARAAGVTLMTAQTLRFTPVLERLRASLPLIAPLEYLCLAMRAERPPHRWLDDPAQAGGGVLLEIGIHLLDLIRFLTGEEAVEAAADLVRRHTGRVEDLAQARFQLASGILCYVEVSRVSGGRLCRAEAVGRNGQLVVDVDRSLLTRIEGRAIVETEAVPDRPTVATVLEAFARSLSTGAPPPVSGEDGLRAVAMAEACYRAAREGRPVPLDPL
jgi:predicted dehydrogenase